MTTLVLPDPSLVVLIGASGSGKSTVAARHFEADEILSSDALRAIVAGNEADQTASAVAFRILYRTLGRRMAEGRLTVVDATNTRAEHRRPLWGAARAAAIPTVAIALDLPAEVIRAQNRDRTHRVVPQEILDRQLAAIRHTLDTGRLAAEAVDHVVVLRSGPQVAALRCERRTHRTP